MTAEEVQPGVGVRVLRFVEFAVLFFVGPTVLAMLPLGRHIIPIILTVAVGCLIALLLDKTFDRRWLWRGDSEDRREPAHLGRIFGLFAVAALGMGLAVWLLRPDLLFEFPKRAPRIWIAVMCLYPLFSVYPQEIVYRAFIFHRYRAIFPQPWFVVALSALAFGYAHVLFKNEVAVLLSIVGGAFFAWTYQRTHSILLVWIEHALYGCFIFTVGLGYYFYSGNVQ